MFDITCIRGPDCFETVAQDKKAMISVLSLRCPRCGSKLSVSAKQIEESITFNTAAPPKGVFKKVEMRWDEGLHYEKEWPLKGPFENVPKEFVSSHDVGERKGFLSSNTPHFLVSHAALDVLTEMLIEGDEKGVPLNDFTRYAVNDLRMLRHIFTKLEKEAGKTNNKPSSGFPRHGLEETNVMKKIREDVDLNTNTKLRLIGRRVENSESRFISTVIGRYKTAADRGALFHLGLISFKVRGDGICYLKLTTAGQELVSLRNDLLHSGIPTVDEIKRDRYQHPESKWWIVHTLRNLPDEARLLRELCAVFGDDEKGMDDILYSERLIRVLGGSGSTESGILRGLIQRWSAIGLIKSRRVARKSIYSINPEFIHIKYFQKYGESRGYSREEELQIKREQFFGRSRVR